MFRKGFNRRTKVLRVSETEKEQSLVQTFTGSFRFVFLLLGGGLLFIPTGHTSVPNDEVCASLASRYSWSGSGPAQGPTWQQELGKTHQGTTNVIWAAKKA